jgi:hypothetical protein
MTENVQSPAPELFPFEQETFHAKYQRYFKMKRGNFFRSITVFRGLWECFQNLNDVWHTEIEDLEHLRESAQMLPSAIFRYAHSRFVVAMELGFSCCIGDAYSVLRGGIEAVAQAHKIHREPNLASVWSEKERGEEEQRRFKQAFEYNKATSLFPSQYGLGELFTYWKQFSNLGPHSGVSSVGKSFEQITTGQTISWAMHYFETNPQRLALYLFALLQASLYMQKAFYSCFESRLKLDTTLERMRNTVEQQKEQQRQHLWATYKLHELNIQPELSDSDE